MNDNNNNYRAYVDEALENLPGDVSVCSFTGHRLIKNDEIPLLTHLLDAIIETLILRGCRIFCTGGALGFDTLAALSVIKQRSKHSDAKVKLNLIMPCPQQSEKWSQSEIITYEFIKEHASNFNYLYSEYSESSMKERNHALVDACDLLVCYCRTKRSGTGSTVNYAVHCDKRVVNICGIVKRLDEES